MERCDSFYNNRDISSNEGKRQVSNPSAPRHIGIYDYIKAYIRLYGEEPKIGFSGSFYLLNGRRSARSEIANEVGLLQKRFNLLSQMAEEYKSAYIKAQQLLNRQVFLSMPEIRIHSNKLVIDGKHYSDSMLQEELLDLKSTVLIQQFSDLSRELTGSSPVVKYQNGIFILNKEKLDGNAFSHRIDQLRTRKKGLLKLAVTHSIKLLELALSDGRPDIVAACLKNREVVFVSPLVMAKAVSFMKKRISILYPLFCHYGVSNGDYIQKLSSYAFGSLSKHDIVSIVFSGPEEVSSILRSIDVEYRKRFPDHSETMCRMFNKEMNFVLAVKATVNHSNAVHQRFLRWAKGKLGNSDEITQSAIRPSRPSDGNFIVYNPTSSDGNQSMCKHFPPETFIEEAAQAISLPEEPKAEQARSLRKVLEFYSDYNWNKVANNRYGLPGGEWFHGIEDEFLLNAGFERFTVTGNVLTGYACHVWLKNSHETYKFILRKGPLPANHWLALLYVYILAAIADMGSGEFVPHNDHPQKLSLRSRSSSSTLAGKRVILRPRKLSYRITKGSISTKTKRERRGFYVGWFFRHCKVRSKEAERKALVIAGILELPEGFTFVSPHWRGGKPDGAEREVVSTGMVESLTRTVRNLLKDEVLRSDDENTHLVLR